MSIEVVCRSGRLAGDPELRFTPSGVAVAKFTVAENDRYLDKASGEWKDGETSFWNCTAWKKKAEAICENLKQGSPVFFLGKAKIRSYEKDGSKRYVTEVEVTEIGDPIRWLDSKPKAQESSFDEEPPF